MSTTQKASTKPSKSKAAPKTAPKAVVKGNKSPVKQLQEVKSTASTAADVAGQFSPIELPVTGPLARKENVEKLSELAQQAGIPLKLSGTGHVITEEQRQGERRQSENDRRNAQRQADELASGAAAVIGRRVMDQEPVGQVEGEAGQAESKAAQAAVPLAQDPQKLAEFQAAMSKLAEQFGVSVNPNLSFGAPTTPRSGRPQQNGITRPGIDTVTGKVWRCADEITTKKGSPASIGEVTEHPDLRQENPHTIRTQYARWRAFNGIKGRAEGEKQVSSKPGVMQWPAMADADYERYMKQEQEGTLEEGYKPWMEAEKVRRDPPQVAAMADEVFEKLGLMAKNNSLKDHPQLQAQYEAEVKRRGQ